MPYLNSRLELCGGNFHDVWGPEGIIASGANAGCWLSDDEIIYQANAYQDPNQYIEIFDRRTGERRKAKFKGADANFGANKLFGNGGQWASFLSTYGVRGDGPIGYVDIPKAGPGSIGIDGSVANIHVYLEGRDVDFITPNQIVLFNDVPIQFVSCYDETLVGWTLGGQSIVLSLDGVNKITPLFRAPCYHLQVFRVNGVPWLIYNSMEGGNTLITHPFDSLFGYKLHKGGNSFYPCARSNGTIIRAAWSANEGDTIDVITERDIKTDEPRTWLGLGEPPIVPPIGNRIINVAITGPINVGDEIRIKVV